MSRRTCEAPLLGIADEPCGRPAGSDGRCAWHSAHGRPAPPAIAPPAFSPAPEPAQRPSVSAGTFSGKPPQFRNGQTVSTWLAGPLVRAIDERAAATTGSNRSIVLREVIAAGMRTLGMPCEEAGQ